MSGLGLLGLEQRYCCSELVEVEVFFVIILVDDTPKATIAHRFGGVIGDSSAVDLAVEYLGDALVDVAAPLVVGGYRLPAVITRCHRCCWR